MALRKACAYYRISRGRKHRSKLNVHRQRTICEALAREHGFRIIEEFIEIEFSSGKEALNQRPSLVQCLEFANLEECVIIVSRIERISLNINLLTYTWFYEEKFDEFWTLIETADVPVFLDFVALPDYQPNRHDLHACSISQTYGPLLKHQLGYGNVTTDTILCQ